MKNRFIFLLGIVLSLTVSTLFAQELQSGSLRITWPLNRTVLQQNSSGVANARIFAEFQNAGDFNDNTAIRFQYRIFNLDPATGAVGTLVGSDWQTGNFENVQRYYNANSSENYLKLLAVPSTTTTLPLNKGWYRLEMRLIKKPPLRGWKQVSITSIKFGVGDVFLIYGQSNAAGYDPIDDINLIPYYNSFGAKDAISSINRPTANNSIFKLDGLPITGLNSEGFSKLEKTNKIYPRGYSSWCWGPLAEKYISDPSFKQPILFLNAAVPGLELSQLSNSSDWQYKGFRNALQVYASILGNKGILWHQGENDAQKQIDGTITDFSYYSTQMKNMIEQSRKDIGINNVMNNNLTWNISKASYFSFPDQSIDNNKEYLGIPFVIHNSNPPNTVKNQSYKRFCSQCFDNNNQPCSSCTINTSNPQHADFQDYNSSLTNAQAAVSSITPNIRIGVSTDDLGKSSRGNHRVIHFSDAALNEVGNRWKNAGITSGMAIESKVIYGYDAVVKQSNGSYQLTAPTGFDRYFWVINDNGIHNHLNSDVTSRVFISPIPSSNFTAVTCFIWVKIQVKPLVMIQVVGIWSLK